MNIKIRWKHIKHIYGGIFELVESSNNEIYLITMNQINNFKIIKETNSGVIPEILSLLM